VDDVAVRPATGHDAPAIRSLVTRALLSAGLDVPSEALDPDLMDLSYYEAPGRGAWVAERDNIVVGCAALDRGDGECAVLRRLAGGGLDALVASVVAAAEVNGAAELETVLPPGLPGTREALERAGFQATPGANELLLRRNLP
jgi:N-acetylglutamate synthase-like GNAT family acetyltransferase